MTVVSAPETDILRGLVADSYRAAVLEGADMRAATDTLEGVRAAAEEADELHVWDSIDLAIGRTDDEALRLVLAQLRERYVAGLAERQAARVAAAGDDAASVWLSAYTTAFTRWRTSLLPPLADVLPDDVWPDVGREDVARATGFVYDDRWAEAYDWTLRLARDERVATHERAVLFATAAEIQLYHLLDTAAVKQHLDEADALASGIPDVLAAWAEYHLHLNEVEQARTLMHEALKLSESKATPYVTLGDSFEQEGNLEAAEEWYREAVERCSGISDGYRRLFRLYGRPELYEDRGGDMAALLERAVAVDPENEPVIHVEMGEAHRQRQDLEAALPWYDHAIALYRGRLPSYITAASACTEAGDFARAESYIARAIELAPEAFAGYWERGWLEEQRGDLEEAAESYRAALARRPAWDGIIRTRLGVVLNRDGREADAASELLLGLEHDPENDTLVDALYEIVDTRIAEQRYEEAEELLGSIQRIGGARIEGSLRNRLGNVFYARGDFAAAATEYEAAIAAEGWLAVYHSNLAGAYRELHVWEQAKTALDEAYKISGDESDYARDLSLLRNGQGNELYERGEFAAAAEHYRAAADLYSSDPVFHSNLGLALQNAHSLPDREETLGRAAAAFAEARRLAPDAADYRQWADWCAIERRLTERVGAPQVGEDAEVPIIGLWLAADLLPALLVPDTFDLREDVLALIETMRARLSARIDLAVPGVRFRELLDPWAEGQYVVALLDQQAAWGAAPPGKRYARADPGMLERLGIEYEIAYDSPFGDGGVWVSENDVAALEEAGVEVWALLDYPIRHLESVVAETVADS
jgi:tetratricopeptide (TPR) repeat protein